MKSKQIENEKTSFTLNKTKIISGNRRLVREKTLQILVAYFVSNSDIELLINHISNREFVTNEKSPLTNRKNIADTDIVLVSEEELININSDTTIEWRKADKEFGRCIINSVIANYDDFLIYIKEASENWELERIAIIDRVIILMAVAEFISAVDVPIKVTINEALELAKIYSTDKAPIFINGILEKIKFIILEKGLISKSEAGKQLVSKTGRDELHRSKRSI